MSWWIPLAVGGLAWLGLHVWADIWETKQRGSDR